ncbi:type VI secretion system-associated FHA domain protein TagH [Pseudomonas sp. A014]|uniref:type VI secretion system-associated FHA domain protein TagH n=1 Tax=Pseudomonas sp. A014 TaxID=3458058 RepID=UPI004035875D
MPVKLWVERYRGQPPAAELACLIDVAGTLGRAPGNDLVLDDPGKYISRSHARVERREGGYYLTDTGSNPSVINERLLGHGRETLLQAGDQLVIGDYQIGVALLAVEQADPDQTGVGATQTLAVFVPPAPVQPPPPPPLEAPVAPRSEPGFSQPRVDTDALAAASILQGEPVFEPAPMLDDPLGLNLFGGQRPTAAFLGTPADHLSPELQALPALPVSPAPQAPEAALIPDGYDALADLLATPAAPASLAPAPTPIATPAPVAAEPTAAGEDPVLQALLEGLGLPHLRASRSPEELARLVGEMLRAATGGTMGVLMARALTKRESHIEMTMIGAHSNNPLKFFPDPTSALSQMLSTDAPAYLPGVQALHAAFDDLRAHEMAVIAGMREALGEVMQRFDPVRIERRLAAPGALERVLPSTRKARLWARFAELHAELARDGDEDLQRLYGEKFSVAYQQQVSRLRDTP